MPAAAYRYFTTDALTGEILAHDLPLSGVEFGPELNGPGAMRGLLAPRYAHLGPSQAEAGTVLLWAERDQRLSWGGLIWRAKPEGDELPWRQPGSVPTRAADTTCTATSTAAGPTRVSTRAASSLTPGPTSRSSRTVTSE